MKNPNQERLGKLMRQYHRNHPWRMEDGLVIAYDYRKPRIMSWWSDVGFVINGRRFWVCWVHPRMKYSDDIEEWADREAGEPPPSLFDSSKYKAVNQYKASEWKKVGRSRKKVISYSCSIKPDDHPEYTAKHKAIEARLFLEGIDWVVRPYIEIERNSREMGVFLCMPVDVRTHEEARALAMFAKRLAKGETTLAQEFPDYQYGQAEWVAEADLRDLDSQQEY